MKQAIKDLAYYRSLPYTRRVRVERDEGGEYFVAYVAELSGLESDGLSELEARYNLQLAFADYVNALLARGATIAEPESWPGAVVGHRRKVINYLRKALRRASVEQTSGVSHEVVMHPADPPGEWFHPETEVETRGGHLARRAG